MTIELTFRTDAEFARRIMRVVDQLSRRPGSGWDYRGGHGIYREPFADVWGHAYQGPAGVFLTLDFRKVDYHDRASCLIGGCPAAVLEQVEEPT